jgi:hypothetical protein
MQKHTRLLLPIIFGLFVLNARPATAQSTIFNVPTTDTVAKGKVHLEFDWQAQRPNTRGLDRLHLLTPKAMVGITRNIEVGLNVPVHHHQFTDDAYLEPNVKWRFAASERKGLAVSAGAIVSTPVSNLVFPDTYGQIYGNVSKKMFSGKYSPRFTGGAYGVLGTNFTWTGPKAGALIGYEQPLHEKIRIVADWRSGSNRVGYLTGGISANVPGNGVASAGYSCGNNSWGTDRENRFLFLRYSVTF